MKKKFMASLLAAAALSAGCAPKPAHPAVSPEPVSSLMGEGGSPSDTALSEDKLVAGTICRKPENAIAWGRAWQAERGLESILTFDNLGFDFRCADISQADLGKLGDRLVYASFDDQTKWPDIIPKEYDREKLMELGRDPGLGVRALHEQGITGKGVGIAILDQALLVDHEEYGDRLRLYQEYHSAVGDVASMHGGAVSSIALGKTTGVAPDALLYYIADDVGSGDDENFVRDMRYYAKDIERLIALNKTLPQEEKIRVISMSVGYLPDTIGAAEMDEAIARARDAGIAVVWVSDRDSLAGVFTGMGRDPYGDPNDLQTVRPGYYLEEYIRNGEYTGADSVLVPMDCRTTAANTGPEGYAFYSISGASWKVPYVAGLYALACQVKPEVTFEEFVKAAQETAHPVTVPIEGREVPYGNVVDPAALLAKLQPFL